MKQNFSTQAVHAGEDKRKPFGALTTPIVQTSTYTFENSAEIKDFMQRKQAEEKPLRDEYGRYSNPTIRAAEDKIAVLEGGQRALLFASGMNAISTILLTFLSSGDHVVMVSDCYHRTREFALAYMDRWGIKTTLTPIDQPEAISAAIRPNTRLIFSETPTNPYLRVVDLERLVSIARQNNLLTIVDSTFATPLNLSPLEFGVDLVIHSASKYLGGHNDLLAGVAVGPEHLIAAIEAARGVIGGISNPNDAYLLLRGLKTLELRVKQQNINGLRVAEYLEGHPLIESVYYPGLPSHPDHHIAVRQMNGYGGVVSFKIKGDFADTGYFIDNLELPYIGPTLGGVESIIEQPAALFSLNEAEWRSAGLTENLVRYALGIEAAEDIIADLQQALAALEAAYRAKTQSNKEYRKVSFVPGD
ncbi:trans-sulfuration enzyme family protein [Chloroflexota bacterium]